MDNFDFTLNLEDVTTSEYKGAKKEKKAFEPMPEGQYEIECTDCSQSPTSKGGLMWKTVFTVIDTKCMGRKIWHNFQVQNANASLQNRHKSEIKKLLILKGVKDFKDVTPSDLIGVKIEAQVKITPPQNGYDAKNEIHYFIFPKAEAQESLPF